MMAVGDVTYSAGGGRGNGASGRRGNTASGRRGNTASGRRGNTASGRRGNTASGTHPDALRFTSLRFVKLPTECCEGGLADCFAIAFRACSAPLQCYIQ